MLILYLFAACVFSFFPPLFLRTRWICFSSFCCCCRPLISLCLFFAIRSFCLWLRQFTTIWTECQGEWREESKLLTALQLCTVGQIEKTSKRRAINGINRSPSSRQRAHINSTPGNTCVVSFHHARTMTLMVASVIDCNNESNKRCRFKLLHIDLCVI